MKLNHILVPTDFTEFSDAAIHCAVQFAQTLDARITLLHALTIVDGAVGEEAGFLDYDQIVQQQEKWIEERLTQQMEKIRREGVDAATALTRGVSPASAILEHIEQNGYGLVVVGTHGRSGFSKWFHGSVAEKIIRHSPIPVLTARCQPQSSVPGKILVPVDFSDHSLNALKISATLARKFGAQIECLHVIEQQLYPEFYHSSVESLLIIDPTLKESSLQHLKEFAVIPGTAIQHVVLEGTTSRVIAQHAQEMGAGLIVMSTRGLTGLEHFLIGSTTERVVRIAPCPVLTVGRERP